jgi:hypothetical protein
MSVAIVNTGTGDRALCAECEAGYVGPVLDRANHPDLSDPWCSSCGDALRKEEVI